MKTLVIGASLNPERYAYRAVGQLRAKKHEVIALGVKDGILFDQPILTKKVVFEDIDTVSLYVGPSRQQEYFDYLLALKPRRVLFNPGTENPKLESLLIEHGIEVERACTLVLLSTDQY